MADLYPMAPRPTDEQWDLRELWLVEHQSVARVAFITGLSRSDVSKAINVCADWLRDSGWAAEFRKAKETGFSDADARMRADIVAAYNEQEAAKE